MENKTHYISICNQKGGVGKSTFTVLVASLLHYRFGRRVLVADCDYPQWSIFDQRRRELEQLDRSKYYKLTMIRQFKASGQKIWPVLECRADTALDAVSRHLASDDETYDYVLFDLPGTVATSGVISLIAALERVFIPMKADRMIMESTITFARLVREKLVAADRYAVRGVHPFWSMIDKRERTTLYDHYDEVLRAYSLEVMQTHVPARSRFSRELQPLSGPVYRSTLYPANESFMLECHLDALCREIISLTERK